MKHLPEISLYIHIPFCSHICGYCHFYVTIDEETSKNALLKALELEWDSISHHFQGFKCVSIYFGGGTPSLFGPKRIEQLLNHIRKSCLLDPEVEITLEVNPEAASKALFSDYAAIGVNRISLGIQSFDDALLRHLTRHHTADHAKEAVYNAAHAGIENISIDLMYDVPKQTLNCWRASLDTALMLPITHLSLYNLTIEPHTPFDRKKALLTKQRPSPEEARSMYEEAVATMEKNGWIHYEISAFGKKDRLSKHNLGYWLGRPFFGLGPSAFSFWQGARFRNVSHLKQYCAKIQEGKSAQDFSEQLSLDAAHREHLILRLRTKEGVEVEAFQKQYGTFSPETLSLFRQFEQLEWLKETDGRIQLTSEGKLFYDSIAAELV